MGYSMIEWDRVGLHNDHGLITRILLVLYIISKRWVTWEKVSCFRFGYEGFVMTMSMIW